MDNNDIHLPGPKFNKGSLEFCISIRVDTAVAYSESCTLHSYAGSSPCSQSHRAMSDFLKLAKAINPKRVSIRRASRRILLTTALVMPAKSSHILAPYCCMSGKRCRCRNGKLRSMIHSL